MPVRLDPNPQSLTVSQDFGYSYPRGLNLRPDSEKHQKLLSMLYQRMLESATEMQKRFPIWKKIDRSLTAYVPLDDAEEIITRNDERKPVSVVVPFSYATLETLLTYMTSAFLDGVIFRYAGMSPEDVVGATLLEKVIEVQSTRAKMALNLHTAFRDGFAYGFGSVSPFWDKKYGKKTVIEEQGWLSQVFGKMMNAGPRRVSRDAILYEGNSLKNIDPYLCLPDPNVAAQDVQKGEFWGYIEPTNYVRLLEGERNGEGYFNVKYLKDVAGQGGQSQFNKVRSNSGRYDRITVSTQYSSIATKPIDVVWLYVNAIPSEWGLGPGEYPEKWLFGVAADKAIVYAKPLGLNHNMFPVAVCAPDSDGYSISPVSRLEVVHGLQTTLDWLFSCYDDQTEVLTERGWIKLSQTLASDTVATVDPITKEFWFERPSKWFSYDYDGYMVNFKSSRMDICVTPNHNMFVKRRYERIGGVDSWNFIPAALLGDTEYKTLGNLRWRGEAPEDLILDEIRPKRYRGHEQRHKRVEINASVLAAYLGWFISEGSVSGTTISIKQSKEKNFEVLDKIMESMPFTVTKYFDESKAAYSWSITDKRFASWLLDNFYKGGHTGEFKCLPDFVKMWDDFHLDLLFDMAMRGDGRWITGYDNLGTYGSTSRFLIDDMQEVALKIGYFSHVKEGTTPAGKPFFTLQLSKASTFPTIAPHNCFKSDYCGKVYCFENSTHLTITRRNGKVAIQGQSHVGNVRKAINDMLVVDPSLVNVPDLEDPAPGKLIRLRRAAWGKGVKDAVAQLQVNDITRQHIQDSVYVTSLIKDVSGSVDSTMGIARKTSERVSATEARGVMGNALSRLGKSARLISLQMMFDLSYMLASHTQQLMTQSLYVDMTGRWTEDIMAEYGVVPQMNRVKVNPLDISIEYDIVMKDGSVPDSGNADVWVQLFQTMSTNPLVMQKFDIVRVFTHIARSLGAKDVNEFMARAPIATAVAPDQTVQREALAGNLVPVGELPV